MKKYIAVILALLLTACANDDITLDQAIQKSKEYSNLTDSAEIVVSEKQGDVWYVELKENDVFYRYKFDIDDGEMVSFSSSDTQNSSSNNQTSSQTQSGQNSSNGTQNNQGGSHGQNNQNGATYTSIQEGISLDEALNIALNNYSLSESQVYDIDISKKATNSSIIIDVDFETETDEYEVEINALTSEIIRNNQERNNDYVSAFTASISRQQAIDTALADRGVTFADLREISLDQSVEGNCVYNIDLHQNGTEYEYVIDASTGEILHQRVD